MSSGNANPTSLDEALDAAVAEEAPKGRLEDAEIQRLVELSRDASYQRSDRVPVKTVEAFEPRSLVSIAMAAQRRRETEMQATDAVLDEDAGQAGELPVDAAPEAMIEGDAAVTAAGDAGEVGMDAAAAADMQAETGEDGEELMDGETGPKASSTSQVDFEAGRRKALKKAAASVLTRARPRALRKAALLAGPRHRPSLSAPFRLSKRPVRGSAI